MKLWNAILVSLVITSAANADEVVDYQRSVKPILKARCYACHGALKQESNLRLDTAAFAVRGGDSGAGIEPGNADDSLIVLRITADESERMPPEGERLKAPEIAAIRQWIAQGAMATSDELSERDPRDHWAFQVPVRPPIPTIEDKSRIRSPIDAFIAAKRDELGLRPQPVADKRVWLRRVSLDLIGLPPTREELDAFVADDSSDAYETVVNRLLDSPHYGERWGRHWMDVWRYSDWWGLGAEVRNSQKHIWHWRDWIVESLNADKGYDQMLREMLAADELYPNDLDRLRATGFLARQYFKFNRTTWLDGTIEHTSKAMLGLTINCAKCHDHKYDPISHEDYYAFRAIFEPYQIRTDAVPGELDFEKDGIPCAFDCNLDAPTYVHVRGDDRNPDTSRVIRPAWPEFLAIDQVKIEPVELPAEAYQPGLREFVVEAHLQRAREQIDQARAARASAKQALVRAEAEANQPPDTATSNSEPTITTSDHAKPLVSDDFSEARPELWEMLGGAWHYENGKLVQSETGAARGTFRLKQLPPPDFEASLKYVPVGGDKWKSIGIAFDVTDPNEVLAYLSSYADGPKSQVSYKSAGNHVYPPNAAQARPVNLGEPHLLTLRVRGTLINVSVDGEHSIAYRLPIARTAGHLELIAFDAAAEFLAFELKALPEDVTLIEANDTPSKTNNAPMSVEQARLALTVADRELDAAETQLTSVTARAEADRLRHSNPLTDNIEAIIAAASRAERVAAKAKADEAVARAELELFSAAADKKADAEKKLESARISADAATAAIEQAPPSYTSLSGALKTLESNLETDESRRKPFPQTSSGRRSALAHWMTDPRNPLPARVAVNHIWSRHFGRPLVATVFDFGRNGASPTHPDLLDWLADELIERDWSMKHLHRLIVLSDTYRLSSSAAGVDRATLDADPENRFYWRANSVRMEAQAIRDSLLHLAGELDLTMGGPSIPASDESSRRRSLYYVHSHNDHQKFLAMFDDANVLDCYRRSDSIVPQQALALENSPLASAMAEKIARRIVDAAPQFSDDEFVRAAFLTVLATEPTEAEQSLAMEGLAQFAQAAGSSNKSDVIARARGNLVHALLNHNDFITIR